MEEPLEWLGAPGAYGERRLGAYAWAARPAVRGRALAVWRADGAEIGAASALAQLLAHVVQVLEGVLLLADWHLEIAPTFDAAQIAYDAPPNTLVALAACPACDVDCNIARRTFVAQNAHARAWTDAAGRNILVVTPVRHHTTPGALSADEMAALVALIDHVTAGVRLLAIKLNVGGYRRWPHLHVKLLLAEAPVVYASMGSGPSGAP